MEAWRFGFDRTQLPPACKFNPTDADIVAHYLLPHALGVPNPHGHAVVDADPCRCPPWELMRRAGHAGSDHAFFFPPPRKRAARRAVAPAAGKDEDGGAGVGGRWDAQKSTAHSVVLVRGGGGGGEMVVTYKLRNLSYHHGDERSTSGWVMNEYWITEPPGLSGTVLARVRVTDKGKQRLKNAAGGDGDGQQQGGVLGPDEPGPSNYGDFVVHGRDGDDDGGGNALGFSGGEESDEVVVCLGDGDGSVFGEMAAYFVDDDDGNGYLNDGSGYYQDGGGGGGDYVNHEYNDRA